MNKDKVVKIKIILLAIFMVVNLITFGLSVVAYALADDIDGPIDLSQTDVLDDLLESTINGQLFDIRDYPIDTANKQCRIINFVEYCYSFDAARQKDYGLYIYVYNPALLDIVDSRQNKISIAVSYNAEHEPNDYRKFDLIFCSKSTGAYERLFYKFKVKDDDGVILKIVNAHLRRYDVAEIELLIKGNANATAYSVSASYRFKGYAKGYGIIPDQESTLECTVTELETIELQVHDTFYRYRNAINKQAQVNTVYFAVDNYYLEKYGRLQKIKAEWLEYRTQPIIVIKKENVYNDLLPWVGVYIGTHNEDIGWILDDGINYWGYNHYAANILTRLTFLFYTGGVDIDDFILDGDTLKQYIYEYDKSAANGYLPVKNGNISADLFDTTVDAGRKRGYNLVEIDAGDTFDLRGFNKSFWSWWISMFYDLEDEDILGIMPIYQVKRSDLSYTNNGISRNLFVSINDVQDFKAFCNNAFAQNKTPFLFRFAVTDYFAEDIAVMEDKFITTQHWGWAYKAQQTVFLDFDIIQLTFARDGKYYVIPVVQSPLDIVADITPPDYTDSNARDWLMIILGVTIAILVIIAALKLFERVF